MIRVHASVSSPQTYGHKEKQYHWNISFSLFFGLESAMQKNSGDAIWIKYELISKINVLSLVKKIET